MTRACRLLIASGAMLLLGVLTVVQARAADEPPARPQRGAGTGGRGNVLQLLRSENVVKDLELTDEQKESIKKLAEQFAPDRATFAGLADLPQEERQKKMAELREKMTARTKEIQEKLEGVLNTKQRERLKELVVQVRGAGGLAEKEVAEALKLTDEQVTKLKEVADQRMKDMREARQGGNNEEAREKMTKLRKESNEKMLEILTPEQKEKFEKMQGKKIELSLTSDNGGPRRRGGADAATETKTETKTEIKTETK